MIQKDSGIKVDTRRQGEIKVYGHTRKHGGTRAYKEKLRDTGRKGAREPVSDLLTYG